MRRITVTTTASLAALAMVLVACTAEDPGSADPSANREPSNRATPADGDSQPFVLPDDLELAASLTGFDACDELLDHVTSAAREQVGPWGLDGAGGSRMGWDDTEEASGDGMDDAADQEVPAPTPDAGGENLAAPRGEMVEGEDFSGTNVQEIGVDEPDRVKSDGEVMYVVTESRLRVLDITGDDPVEIGGLDLRDAWDAQLLLDGDRLLVTSTSHAAVPFADEPMSGAVPGMGSWGTTSMTLIDVTDPTGPEVTERLTVDGWTVSSRLVEGVARVVVRTDQGHLPWTHPQGTGLRAERAATEANRQLIDDSEVEDWIPYVVHETAQGQITERSLLDCDRVAHPDEFAGLGMLSVLTIDLDDGLLPGDEALGVLAGGDTVYASTERLYVATTRWFDWAAMDEREAVSTAEEATTEIHAFDISDPATTTYLASGTVPGYLLDQWAMSEHDGHLRVASTIGDSWWWGGGGDREPSSSLVTVLEQQGGELVQIGQVDGLGPTERIYAVRFMGDVGYVVTFREVDPLYTLDLTDPTDPRVTGELKIMGYSAYLHPMGDDLLLGVGQDADEQGMTKGTQLSLFDVADPADPRRIDQVTLDDGFSDAEHDHRAFLHWPATGLTVVPFQRWSWDEETQREDIDNGALAFTVTREGGIETLRTLSHLPSLRVEFEGSADAGDEDVTDGTGGDAAVDRQVDGSGNTIESDVVEPDLGTSARPADELWIYEWGWQSAITRTMVSGDRVLTLSDVGVATHDLDDLRDIGWYRFGS